MALKKLSEADIEGKRVLARFDFNVPLNKEGKITDPTRIDLSLPTIREILEKNPDRLILMSHLGRPDGEAKLEYSLEPVANYLAEQLETEVTLTERAVDAGVESLLKLGKNKIILLENLRFHPEEEANDREFARKLAGYADLFVHDAFGTAHRKHASTYSVISFFKGLSYMGNLFAKEVEALTHVLEKPEKPFLAIIGGAKVSDKIQTIERLLPQVQNLLIGGAMAYPFLKAKGFEVGKSLCGDEDVKLAKSLLQQNSAQKIVLPLDHLMGKSPDDQPSESSTQSINQDLMGLDIGAKTIAQFSDLIKQAKTIIWNGPMGFFEKPAFSKGTFEIARLLSESQAYTLVGGGDSVSAVKQAHVEDKLSHVSTGGGASLEFIEKGTLPGIQALKFGVNQ